jgi:glycosyltransferase involved in cell wall biosynthesis
VGDVGRVSRGRILYVITDPVSLRLLRGQLAQMVASGFEVQLACASGPELDRFAMTEGVAAHAVRLTRSPHPVQDLVALFQLVRLMRQIRPALVNASTPKAGLLGTIAAWIGRVPVRVYVVRGLRFENASGWNRRMLKLFERLSIRCATNVIFNSRSLRSAAEGEGVIRVHRGIVLGAGSGNGLDFARFVEMPTRAEARERFGISRDQPVIGFVGRYTRDKGISDLLDAFDRVTSRLPGAQLVLVGGFDDSDPVSTDTRDRIANDSNIIDLGWMDEPVAVFAAMDVLAFPSYREGLPNVPLEAQASGIPVVAYAATGTIDAVLDGETGVLVTLGSIEGMADVVVELLGDPWRREAMSRRGNAWVTAEFARERVWRELAENYGLWLC